MEEQAWLPGRDMGHFHGLRGHNLQWLGGVQARALGLLRVLLELPSCRVVYRLLHWIQVLPQEQDCASVRGARVPIFSLFLISCGLTRACFA